MKKLSNLAIILLLIVGVGFFIFAEVLYFEWFFPEINEAAGGGIILYALIIVMVVVYLQLTHMFNPIKKFDQVSQLEKRKLKSEEELRKVLLKNVVILIFLGLVAPFFFMAIFWVL